LDHHGFRVQTIYIKHCSHPKGRNDGRITSLSHRTRGGYKNLPLPPPLPVATLALGSRPRLRGLQGCGPRGRKPRSQGKGIARVHAKRKPGS